MKAGMTGISRLLPSHLEIVGWGLLEKEHTISSEVSDTSRSHYHCLYYFRTSTPPTISTMAGT